MRFFYINAMMIVCIKLVNMKAIGLSIHTIGRIMKLPVWGVRDIISSIYRSRRWTEYNVLPIASLINDLISSGRGHSSRKILFNFLYCF